MTTRGQELSDPAATVAGTINVDERNTMPTASNSIVDDVQDNAPKPGPCPAWCTDAPGHDYDSVTVEGDTYMRFHSGLDHVFDRDDHKEAQPNGIQKRAPGSVQIAALEDNDGTTVTYGEPVISVWNAEDLNVDECSRLISALSAARAELIRIAVRPIEADR